MNTGKLGRARLQRGWAEGQVMEPVGHGAVPPSWRSGSQLGDP